MCVSEITPMRWMSLTRASLDPRRHVLVINAEVVGQLVQYGGAHLAADAAGDVAAILLDGPLEDGDDLRAGAVGARLGQRHTLVEAEQQATWLQLHSLDLLRRRLLHHPHHHVLQEALE